MLKKIFISVGQYFLFLKMVFRKPEKWKIFYSCFKMSLFCFLISSIAAFNGVQVLKDINVTYEPGKCNMIIGASGGMQKRVGIARAIALNPSFLFCDEPNSGLDPYTSILIDRLISDLTKEFNEGKGI